MKITGNTFKWKKELKAAGLKWNPDSRTWDGELNSDFAATQIGWGIRDGELRNIEGAGAAAAMSTRNGPGRFEVDNIAL